MHGRRGYVYSICCLSPICQQLEMCSQWLCVVKVDHGGHDCGSLALNHLLIGHPPLIASQRKCNEPTMSICHWQGSESMAAYHRHELQFTLQIMASNWPAYYTRVCVILKDFTVLYFKKLNLDRLNT